MKSALFLIGIIIATLQAHAVDVFVATNGNDNNPGTKSSPLKTLKGARDKVRSITSGGIPNGGVRVLFRGGTYPISQTVDFDSRDSGTSNRLITYTRYGSESVIFDGSVSIPGGNFSLVSGADRNRLPNPNARNNVYVTNVGSPTIRAYLRDESNISIGNKMQLQARWPEKGYGHPKDFAGTEATSGTGTYANPRGASFALEESVPYAKWRNEIGRGQKTAYAIGYMSAPWFREVLNIASVSSSNKFKLVDRARYNFGTDVVRLAIKGCLTGLSHKGEWYFDPQQNKLYIWPTTPLNGSNRVYIWGAEDCINMNNTNHVRIERITFQHFHDLDNTGAVVNMASNCNNIRLQGCTFRRLGGGSFKGVVISPTSTNCQIVSCNFYDIPSANIVLNGGSRGKTSITHGNNKVINCHFTQYDSRDFRGRACVINGAGNTFEHNLIHNMNSQPVNIDGVDHHFSYNELFNTNIEEGDGGMAYIGGSLNHVGNVFNNNFLHHCMSIPEHTGKSGFHSDDHNGGNDYMYNTFYKTGFASLKIGGGAGHSFVDNVVIDNWDAVRIIRPWQNDYNGAKNLLATDPNNTVKLNYIGRAEKEVGNFANNASASYRNGWNSSFWAQRYPTLAANLKDSSAIQPDALGMYPHRNVVDGNVFYRISHNHVAKTETAYASETNSTNLSGLGTHFVGPNKLNFKWKTPLPAFAVDTDFENVGLFTNAYRKTLPNKNAYREAVRLKWASDRSFQRGSYDRSTINSYLYYNTGRVVGVSNQIGSGPRP